MIPKIIHTCWFSGEEYPDDVKRCMKSWETVLPDYEVRVWNATILADPDIQNCPYVVEAIQTGKWAFASDYVRLYVLYKYGGIYLDGDIEVIKSFNHVLDNKAFTGFEDNTRISAWIFGSERGNELFKEFLDDYVGRHFLKEDGTYDLTPNPIPITKCLKEHGLKDNTSNEIQKLDHITIFPMEYFCPFNPRRPGKDIFTENTICNHHFSGAWRPKNEQLSMNIELKLRKVFGYRVAHGLMLPFFVYNRLRADGIKETVRYSYNRIHNN